MISAHVNRPRRVSVPFVLAIFSFRYDAHLVPDLLTNIRPMVDGWISFDDRAATEEFSDEPRRRRALLAAARDAGADWVLAVDPDERFERRLADAMPALTAVSDPVVYSFPLRELYAPDVYRIDGIWGRKRQGRLIRVPSRIAEAPTPLHAPWHTLIPDAAIRRAEFNLYHLKMITPARRRARRDLYNRLDPERRSQRDGYDYLADDRHMRLERIPEGRGFDPPFVEDYGLWMADEHAPPTSSGR